MDTTIKSKAIKYVVKKMLPGYKWRCLILHQIKTIESYCVSSNKNTGNKYSSFKKTKQNRLMFVSYCAACGNKKSCFIKIQEVH